MSPCPTRTQSGSKGFTLVELIVALAISVIVIAAAGALLLGTTNLFTHQATKVEQETIADSSANFVRDRLQFARTVELTTVLPAPAALTDKAVLYIGDESGNLAEKGYLYFKRAGDSGVALNAFGTAYYKSTTLGLDLTVSVEPDKPKVFKATITLYVNGSESYTTTKTYQLMNSTPTDAPTSTLASGDVASPCYLIIG